VHFFFPSNNNQQSQRFSPPPNFATPPRRGRVHPPFRPFSLLNPPLYEFSIVFCCHFPRVACWMLPRTPLFPRPSRFSQHFCFFFPKGDKPERHPKILCELGWTPTASSEGRCCKLWTPPFQFPPTDWCFFGQSAPLTFLFAPLSRLHHLILVCFLRSPVHPTLGPPHTERPFWHFPMFLVFNPGSP